MRAAGVRAAAALAEAGARDEALAEFVPERRRYSIRRRAKMRPIGRVWRLGVFLLARDGTLLAAGPTTRAVPPGHPNYQSASGEERRAYRAAAFQGPFERGEVVNFAARPLEPVDAASPLTIVGGEPLVRWSPGAAPAPFDAYLAERVDLLVHPPDGA
ncbi:hypothetical protein G127AT_06445 [Agromyces archimandritae]|uniref:Uncharacterized protein n=1 Tax=Agromyces archimandritae TaxID=2781962 RepID=A0A975FQ18_9MICO|nr:hypothetical protein G127AT_06445 [Agromyces archimandritae]